MCRLTVPLFALFAVACNAGPSERFHSEEDQVSLRELPGWSPAREKGTLVFSAPEEHAGTTIAIRSVLPEEGLLDRGPYRLLAATREVLGSFHDADLRGPSPLSHDSLAAFSFELTYAPPGKHALYERRHVVLVGKGRIYHALHTAPQGELLATAPLFADVVQSLREEG